MTNLSWNEVLDRPAERLEFGACHVNHAWRRHKTQQSKFLGLNAAFKTSNHRLPLLLQAVSSNYNARNHPERGAALFAAVWFHDSSWAILCSPTHAVLASREELEEIREEKQRNDEIIGRIQRIFAASPLHLRQQFDETFYDRVLRVNDL